MKHFFFEILFQKLTGMSTYLVNKDVDWLIAKQLLRDGRPNATRFLNRILLSFSPLTSFVKICSMRYQQLLCRYRQVKSVEELVPAQIHNNSFWHKAVKDFSNAKPGERIVFDGNQKGPTRQRLYMLGTLFGCRWIVTNRTRRENYNRKGRYIYPEEKIDLSALHTMKQLRKLRMDLPDMWLESGQLNESGEILYRAVTPEENKTGRGWYKRGIMCNGPCTIIFIKL